MRKEFREMNPSFARIFINHRNKKNPVTMEYPQRDDDILGLITSMWLHIYGRLIMIFSSVVSFIVGFVSYVFTHNLNTLMPLMFLSFITFIALSFIAILTLSVVTKYKNRLYKSLPDRMANHYKKNGYFNQVIKRKLDLRTFTIPLFQNIMLDYKLTGDFKKYIHKVIIHEHEFNNVRYKKGKRVSSERNTDTWFAVFEFTHIPKKGLMKIEFI